MLHDQIMLVAFSVHILCVFVCVFEYLCKGENLECEKKVKKIYTVGTASLLSLEINNSYPVSRTCSTMHTNKCMYKTSWQHKPAKHQNKVLSCKNGREKEKCRFFSVFCVEKKRRRIEKEHTQTHNFFQFVGCHGCRSSFTSLLSHSVSKLIHACSHHIHVPHIPSHIQPQWLHCWFVLTKT